MARQKDRRPIESPPVCRCGIGVGIGVGVGVAPENLMAVRISLAS